jgi:hypothetical protein
MKNIFETLDNTIREGAYNDATLTTQGPPNSSRAVVPTDEYPFTARPKSRLPGVWESESTSFKVVNTDTGKTIDFGIDQAKAEEIVAAAKEENINAEVVKMKDADDVGTLKENQSLSSDMLNYADMYHVELVDTMKGVSTHPDKRTGGFYIKFPHYNGPGPGALFGKEVSLQIEKSKAAAKAAALKTYTKFQDNIEDYEISDSKSGVYGNVWLWVMPKNNMNEEMAPKEMAGRIKSVFDKVNGAQHPVQTPEWHKNRFKNKYGISFPETLKGINKEQALAMNKYANDMKIRESKLKEMDTKTYAGVDAMTTIKKDPKYGTLQGDAKKDLEDKLKAGGAVELEENLAGVVAIGKKAMEEALATSNYQTIEDADTVFEELKRGAYYVLEDLYNDYAPNAGAAPDEMMEDYMKSRKDSNLMEHMDKHRKRSTLMEGAMKRFFKAFDGGKTDDEVVHEYAKAGLTVPDSFVSKARKQWESLKKAKLDLELSEKEAKGFKQIHTVETDVVGMEPMDEKQMASGLFN